MEGEPSLPAVEEQRGSETLHRHERRTEKVILGRFPCQCAVAELCPCCCALSLPEPVRSVPLSGFFLVLPTLRASLLQAGR